MLRLAFVLLLAGLSQTNGFPGPLTPAEAAAIADCANSTRTIADAPCSGFECLKQYVDKDDGIFSWTDTGIRLNGTNGALLPANRKTWVGYVLNVTSQKWLTPQDFNFEPFGGVPRGHIWWHILVVVVPSNRRSSTAGGDLSFMYMTGGTNAPGPTGGVPDASSEDVTVVASTAMATGCIGATLLQTPNQHMVFAADPLQKSRSEDAVIAFTWQRFVQDPASSTEWPLRLPMTKGGVKAMDAIQVRRRCRRCVNANSKCWRVCCSALVARSG